MQTEKEYIVGREINALRSESVGEYSLPDYNGDVKRVLTVRTRAFPTGKFVGEDLLEFSGTVGYEVVYLDAENNVTHTEFSTDYEGAVRINSDTYCASDVQTCVVSCNARLVGPRKFSVKCSLETDIRISERRVYSIGGDAFAEYEPEVILESAEVFSSAFGEGESRDIREEIVALDGVIVDEAEILLCDAASEVVSVERTDEGASVKGSVNVSMLYKNGDGLPRRSEKVIPCSAEVVCDGFDECACLDGRFDITSLKSSVDPTDDGVALAAELSLIPRIYAKQNCPIDVVTDAYLKERGSDNEYSEFGYVEHICTERCESAFAGEYPLSECDIDKIDAMIHSDASVRVDSCEIADSLVKIAGEIKFSAIACQVFEGDEYNYVPVKFALPFEQNVNINCQNHSNLRANTHVNVCDVKMEIGENVILPSCTLVSSVSVFSEKRQRCLGASYLTDESFDRDETVITVYYPDSSESLFDIAKRFHTSTKSIAEANRLTESVFASQSAPIGSVGIKKLLIK